MEALIERAMSAFGSVDVLINNAGIGCFGETPDLDSDEWRRVEEEDFISLEAARAAFEPLIAASTLTEVS